MQAQLILLRPGDQSHDLVLTMEPAGGSISGRVMGAQGGDAVPLEGVLVGAKSGRHEVLTRSGRDGGFLLRGVPAGSVRVRYCTDDTRTSEGRYLPLYHPDAPDSSQAETYDLADGDVVDLDPVILPPAGVIGGLVRASDTDAPLPGRPVEVRELLSGRIWTLRTSSQGRFLQGGLSSGSYTIRVNGKGTVYISDYYRMPSGPMDPAFIDLRPGEFRDGFEINLAIGGVISGNLRKDDGSPIEEGAVYATHLNSQEVFEAVTDEYGFYEVIGLPSGQYLVYAPIVNRYYPDATDPESARPISITAPEVVTRINLSGPMWGGCRIPSGSQGFIHGIVDSGSPGLTRGLVEAVSDSDTVSVGIDGPGVYLLGCLPRGMYRVGLYTNDDLAPRYFEETNLLAEARFLSVTPPDTTWEVDFRPERSVKIAGMVLDPDGRPIPDVRVRAEEPAMRLRAAGVTDENGRFLLTRLGNQGEDGMPGGLPAGSWRVVAESTLVPDPVVTPVMQPILWAEPLSGGCVAVSWAVSSEFSWYFRLYRSSNLAEEWSLLYQGASSAGADSESLRYLDSPPQAGSYRYRLIAWVLVDSDRPLDPDGGWSAWSELVWVLPEIVGGNSLQTMRLSPNPWNGKGDLGLSLDHPLVVDGKLQLFTVDGRLAAEITWPAGAGAMSFGLPEGVSLSSGVHFVRLFNNDQEVVAPATLLLVR